MGGGRGVDRPPPTARNRRPLTVLDKRNVAHAAASGRHTVTYSRQTQHHELEKHSPPHGVLL